MLKVSLLKARVEFLQRFELAVRTWGVEQAGTSPHIEAQSGTPQVNRIQAFLEVGPSGNILVTLRISAHVRCGAAAGGAMRD